ncbi:hypothetical protein F3Y22_tig00110015pilonHSYRG00195 [Hibiscus syriacus]|uniref:CCHC-type domain-containing protein n=1 Tax=Hibiscus syriacus TaxID=106335 RepID=A0A6A3BTU7_HIBSY|nr:hypothetical protein F3Y22_tig00110015pilonHSYRG00195 [Hibiscus syriacus]
MDDVPGLSMEVREIVGEVQPVVSASKALSYAARTLKGVSSVDKSGKIDFVDQDIVFQDGDVSIDRSGLYPVVQFSSWMHNAIDHYMRESVIVCLLGRTIGYWMLSGLPYGYYSKLGPWIIFGNYLIVQPWSRNFSTSDDHPSQIIVWIRLSGLPYGYYSKFLFRLIASEIGKVIKVDYNPTAGERGKFAGLVVAVDLTKPLLRCVGIDDFVQRIEYEGLQNICFRCGKYGHVQNECETQPTVPTTNNEINPNTENITGIASDAISDLFGTWIIAANRKRRLRKTTEGGRATGATNCDGQSTEGVYDGNTKDNGNQVLAEFQVREATKNGGKHVVVTINENKPNKRMVSKGSGDLEKGGALKVGNVQVVKSLKVKKQPNYKLPGRPLLSYWVQSATTMIDGLSNDRMDLENQGDGQTVTYLNPCYEGSTLTENYVPSSSGVVASGCCGTIMLQWRCCISLINLYMLPQLSNLHPGNDHPWLLGGDFNALLNLNERLGGAFGRLGVSKAFNDFVFYNAIVGIGFQGPRSRGFEAIFDRD